MATQGTKRGVYARRHGLEALKQGRPDPEHRLSSQVEVAIDRWLTENAKRRKTGPPPPRFFHRQHQAPIRKSLAELLAEADKREREPLDCSGWENQIYDGDREGVLALE